MTEPGGAERHWAAPAAYAVLLSVLGVVAMFTLLALVGYLLAAALFALLGTLGSDLAPHDVTDRTGVLAILGDVLREDWPLVAAAASGCVAFALAALAGFRLWPRFRRWHPALQGLAAAGTASLVGAGLGVTVLRVADVLVG